MLAGISHIKKTYQRTSAISSMRFVSTYRDALFAAGWKLIDVTKLDEPADARRPSPCRRTTWSNGRNIYARVSQEPDGPYEINVADVGAEDWSAMLARDCRVRDPQPAFRSRSADAPRHSSRSRRSRSSRRC